ncbi:hypothetical protein [Pedobacter sp. ASV28]|uniref:hypothetical protein n=1 Tax=Pedobacter sp. ASV28 TaxID=2795123 RepID=UPI0018EDD17C|nr:hypothetical protein [Pedobacter sp. ASV28]
MLARLQQPHLSVYTNTKSNEVAKASTYKERVKADRIVMLAMLVITIIGAVLTS